MKKMLAAAIIGALGLGLATPASAGGPDEYPTVPDYCEYTATSNGPSRQAHAPAIIDVVDCDDLDICVVLPTEGDGGPSRTPHVEDANDCDPSIPEECVIHPASGPSRSPHGLPTEIPIPDPPLEVSIPQECQELLYEDDYPEIDDVCGYPLDFLLGPARAAHTPAGAPLELEVPDCSELDICIITPESDEEIILDPSGPGRLPHVESAEDCGDVAEECIIPLDLPKPGPSRAAHQPAGEEPIVKKWLVIIPQPCQEQLSLALLPAPVVGSNTTPIMLVAAALVLTGGLLVVGQRRIARR